MENYDIFIYNRAINEQEIQSLFSDLTEINQSQDLLSLKIYPNPVSTFIFVDNINTNKITEGCFIKITNTLNQVVFQSPINQQQFCIDLVNINSNGVHFVHLTNGQGVLIETVKIILQ